MLKSLDVLIGLTVIMLALSMGVTMLTQFVTTVLNSRGRHLKRGVMDLLNQIDPALATRAAAAGQTVAGRVADAILTHPLISATGRRLGTVVHREELTRLLLFLTDDTAALDGEAKAVLKRTLARNSQLASASHRRLLIVPVSSSHTREESASTFRRDCQPNLTTVVANG